MKRNELVLLAHNALQNVDLSAVQNLLASVNLSPLEKKTVYRSEIEKSRIREIADEVNLSVDSVMRIKTAGMKKIAMFLQKNERTPQFTAHALEPTLCLS